MPKYTGSADIATNMQKYNKDYFKDYTSTNPNMIAVAYMLDTATWSPFATSSEGYAEWAIGGPTVELLFTAYNKYKGLTGNIAYKADAASATGYKISKDGGTNYANYYSSTMIALDTSTVDNPYSIYNQKSQSNYYWLASPSRGGSNCVVNVHFMGSVCGNTQSAANNDYYYKTKSGFRPIVLLNSNFQLEKMTSGGKEVFKIVPKTE